MDFNHSTATPPRAQRRSNPTVSPRLKLQSSPRLRSQSRASRPTSVYDDIPEGMKPVSNTATLIKWKMPTTVHGRRQKISGNNDEGLKKRPSWSMERPRSGRRIPKSNDEVHPYDKCFVASTTKCFEPARRPNSSGSTRLG
eukprot:CAMPEP_0117804964 /NCGR_PEP_ID=MMETSP0948-20121206/17516_1 /TAXON_ID=44440 /ORGANISM="Chattonella subsalsa, Strain CCMP2191" /LENGTH=140 /DNA_ID=CAMNT_0005638809 /DNA_START=59 /DNA_END=481 /DNA_ORIENTATION=+